MKVLLVHPDHNFPGANWDLVVDLGRAPVATYGKWSAQARCRALSIYDFSEETDDLHHIRNLVRLGTGFLMDQYGIDWWDVLSSEMMPQLYQFTLVRRLATYINRECELHCTGRDYRCAALHTLLGAGLANLERPSQKRIRRLRHYKEVITTFSASQLLQIAKDKYDRQHTVQRYFTKRTRIAGGSAILLPSAYINVSRTALSYAGLLPQEHFLLVCARDNAKPEALPPNVQAMSLDPYFGPADRVEIKALLEIWHKLKARLTSSALEFELGAAAGLLDRMPALIEWGLAIRNAWNRIFKSGNIRACFCADHNNPYTRVPLLLAHNAGLPTLACHHGALDAWMAIKTQQPAPYLAKSEMEFDYMKRVCGVAPGKIAVAASSFNATALPQKSFHSEPRPWLVFFSEPYGIDSWRMDQVYGELLPYLCSLAEGCALKLVFKLHPFETVAGHRKLLRRILPADGVRKIEIIAGTTTERIWRNTAVAITVQSTVAVECAMRGIPIFLCGWLRDLFPGYLRQYEKFGVGHVLDAAAQIAEVPRLLESQAERFEARPDFLYPVAPEILRDLLCGAAPARSQFAAQG